MQTTAATPREILAYPASVPLWPHAGRALALTRSGTYELVKRGEFPVSVLQVGQRYRVLRTDLLAYLKIEDRALSGATA